MLYAMPNMSSTTAPRMATVIAPFGSILASGRPRACRGPRGGSFRLRQHLHLHALPGAHLHLPGFMHPPLPLHLHLAGAGAFRRGLFSPASLASLASTASLHALHLPASFSGVLWNPPCSLALLIAARISSSDRAGLRPWPPRALGPPTPLARYRVVHARRVRVSIRNVAAICSCVMSLRGFARSVNSARTAQTRIRCGLYRVSSMTLTRSAYGLRPCPCP